MERSARDLLLQVSLVPLMVAGLAGMAFGLWMVGDDLSTSGEFLDGVGAAFGGVIAAAAAVPTGLAAWSAYLSQRGRSQATGVALAAGLTGGGVALVGGWLYQPVLLGVVLALLPLLAVVVPRAEVAR